MRIIKYILILLLIASPTWAQTYPLGVPQNGVDAGKYLFGINAATGNYANLTYSDQYWFSLNNTWTYNSGTGVISNAVPLGVTNLLLNGDFASDLANWSLTPGPGTIDWTAGTIRFTEPGAGHAPMYASQSVVSTQYGWYAFTATLVSDNDFGYATLRLGPTQNSASVAMSDNLRPPTGVTATLYGRASGTTLWATLVYAGNNSKICRMDNALLQTCLFKDFLFTRNYGSLATVTAKTAFVNTASPSIGSIYGTITHLDNPISPSNYFWAYRQSGTVYAEKVISGVPTSIIVPAAVAYVQNATVDIVDDGSTIKIYYNNAQVGATYTKVGGDPSGTYMGAVSAGGAQVGWTLSSYGP